MNIVTIKISHDCHRYFTINVTVKAEEEIKLITFTFCKDVMQ